MRFFVILLFFFAGTASAASDLTIQSLNVRGKTVQGDTDDAQISMPFVKSGNKALAANINDRLYIGQLHTLAPRQPHKYLTEADGVVLDGLSSQAFSISRQDDRIITFAFDAEGCGAYCESSRVFYSFDLASGHAITANDLFTEAGMRELSNKMRREKLTRYRAQLTLLKKELQESKKGKGPIDQDTLDDLNDRITLNSDCAEQAAKAQTSAALLESFNYYNYELSKKSFNLTAGRCSNHAMRALDDVDNVTLALPYEALKPYLTDYGKSILLGQGDEKPSNLYGQVLRGHLGNNAIVMMLNRQSDDSIDGVYFYEKFRKPIDLNGRVKDHQFELTEQAEGSPQESKMRLTANGMQLEGQWKGNKQFDMQLTAP